MGWLVDRTVSMLTRTRMEEVTVIRIIMVIEVFLANIREIGPVTGVEIAKEIKEELVVLTMLFAEVVDSIMLMANVDQEMEEDLAQTLFLESVYRVIT